MPLTVGGGVRSADEMRDVLRAGADKVAVNTAAIGDPSLLARCARRFGRQCVVISVDARAVPDRRAPGRSWSRAVGDPPVSMPSSGSRVRSSLGAGEVLLTSIDRDGTREGFDLPLAAGGHGRGGRAGRGVRRCRLAGRHGRGDHRGPRGRGPRRVDLPSRHPLHRRGQGRARGRGRARPPPTDARTSRHDGWSTQALDPAAIRYGDAMASSRRSARMSPTSRVLMVAWQDAEAIEATLRTGELHLHSRSRGALWRKGETSGNVLHVRGAALDCDGDAILWSVSARPVRPATRVHGPASTSNRRPPTGPPIRPRCARHQGFAWLDELWATIDVRRAAATRGLVHHAAARRGCRPARAQGRRRGGRGAHGGQGRCRGTRRLAGPGA